MNYNSKYEHYKKKINKKRIVQDIIIVYIIAVFFVLLFNATVLQAYKVPSNSMEPQINENTKILVNKYVYGLRVPFIENKVFDASKNIKRGDVIIFVSPGYINKNKWFKVFSSLLYTLSFTTLELTDLMGKNSDADFFIKRVVGVPGDTIEYKLINDHIEVYINNLPENKIITRNYTTIKENKANSLLLGDMILLNKYQVKEGEYYVLGDNRVTAADSRIWGGIKEEQVVGKAILKYFPFSRFGVIR